MNDNYKLICVDANGTIEKSIEESKKDLIKSVTNIIHSSFWAGDFEYIIIRNTKVKPTVLFLPHKL
jgi:phenylpyruvate tautomerase PptA (4-oxalocrotonate tautomerase family)